MSSGADGVWTAAWDDRASVIASGKFTGTSIATQAQPTGVAQGQSATYISTPAGILVHPSGSSSGGASFTHAGEYTAVAASPSSDLVAFGSGKTLTLATLSNGKLEPQATFTDSKADILCIAISPDGGLVAAGDAAGRVVLVDAKEKKTVVSSRWAFHTARVHAVAFSEDGKRVASVR
jgi:WD40 repeat protein